MKRSGNSQVGDDEGSSRRFIENFPTPSTFLDDMRQQWIDMEVIKLLFDLSENGIYDGDIRGYFPPQELERWIRWVLTNTPYNYQDVLGIYLSLTNVLTPGEIQRYRMYDPQLLGLLVTMDYPKIRAILDVVRRYDPTF